MRKYFSWKKIRNAALFFRTYGFKLFVKEVIRDILQKPWLFSTWRYSVWIRQNEPTEEDLSIQKRTDFSLKPKISIVVPLYNTPLSLLKAMLASVLNQTYSNWELCIADGGSTAPGIEDILLDLGKKDSRVRITSLKVNKGIAGNSNEALALSTGDYVAFLDHDDTLAPFALFEIVKALNEIPEGDFIYSDEDMMSENGKIRFEPHFKPDWSPDNLRSCNYITHLMVIKKELLSKTGRFREGFEGSQDYDLILRATESAKKIVHIPKVLYHWRLNKDSCAGNSNVKFYAYEAGRKALSDHLSRTGIEGIVEYGASPGLYKITCRINNPKVSIIIPNRDHANDLNKCVYSILNRSTYKNCEIIIIDNSSVEDGTATLYDELGQYDNIRIIRSEETFNYSSVNNHAVSCAICDVVLFLNNDTEVISADWLERMLEHATRRDVGAVGAKLYYRDDTVQHAGVILGSGGRVLHPHRFYTAASFGYRARLKFVQNVSAVTGACLMMRKGVFEEIGGFDEGFEIAFGDIDLCLRLREKGYLVLWTPYAELYHEELKTRGFDNTKEKRGRFEREEALFLNKWKEVLSKSDPYYNPNLTQDRDDVSIRIR